MICLSAIGLALTTYLAGSTGAAATIAAISTLRNPYPSAVAVHDLRRNLEALFCPRLKVGIRKFGELIPLKCLAVSERRRIVL
jgi:hypothetical protein